MAKPSLTKAEIASRLAELWDTDNEDAQSMFEDMLGVLKQGLIQSERVYLDDFGTLHAKLYKGQQGKFVPGLGKVDIKPHVDVVFRISENMEADLLKSFVLMGLLSAVESEEAEA
jgi:nucleoid DNA-binding protein